MSEAVIVHRTDTPCRNCKHSIGNHPSIYLALQGCRDCMREKRNPVCTWVSDAVKGTVPPEEKKKFTLGDMT